MPRQRLAERLILGLRLRDGVPRRWLAERLELESGRLPAVLEAWIEAGPPTAWPDGRWLAVCDADLIADTAVIRAGDRTPIVDSGGPVWIVGYGVDRRVRVTTSTRRFLWLSAEPANP